VNSKQQKILERILSKPIKSNIKWSEIISVMKGLGAEIDESRSGSRVAIHLHSLTLTLHKPHPQKEMSRRTIEDIQDFLIDTGVDL